MNKAKLLKATNFILIILAVIQISTSLMLFFRLFMSDPRVFKAVIKIHVNNGLAFILVALIHLFLNWGWVKANFLVKRQ